MPPLRVLNPAPALAAGIDDATNKPLNLFQMRQAKPVQLQQKAPTLEDMIGRSPMPTQFMQPIPLKGVNISGLYPKSVETLGFNYFVVVDNTKWPKMSDIYRESRLSGKSNFVTADSITHPYLAFSNRVLADAIVMHMAPELRTLLESMQRVAVNDYRQSDDAEVRSDIERNIAYVAVALRLLNPQYEVPSIGNVPEMVDEEVKSITEGKISPSAVFPGDQDFSVFKPMGWYNANKDLQNFYRCKQWISCAPFAVTDVTNGGAGHSSNSFRRSVLLFRSLDQANILGRPALETWQKLSKAFTLLGTPFEGWHERTLYPPDYKLVLADKAADLKVTLQALAEPLFRTKLMLAVRKQRPNNIGSESIFDLSGNGGSSGTTGIFRLFAMYGEPEMPWLRGVTRLYPTDKQSASSWPLGLLDMYAWGSPQAGNVLADNLWALDPNIAQVLPDLQHCIVHRGPTGQLETQDTRSWKILSQFFKPNPQGQTVPGALRTDLWYSRRVMSAYAGWVDSLASIAPVNEPVLMASAAQNAPAAGEGNTSETMGKANGGEGDQQPRRVSKAAPFHYLEPTVDVYHALLTDATQLQAELESMHYFPQRYKARLGDFTRLFQRLEKIADTESKGFMIAPMDRKLLADIDLVLDKVDVPLPAVLPFDAGKFANAKGEEALDHGFNLAIGRPGMLYIIYQNPRTMEWTLGRGAVYTYYELPAPLLTQQMWEHKIDAGFAKPPIWSQKWELVQQPAPAKKPAMVKME